MNEPIVPRPPTLNLPKRLNGAEQVIRLGVIWRITITFDGSWGINFEVILAAFPFFYYIGLELTPFVFFSSFLSFEFIFSLLSELDRTLFATN